MQLADAAGSFLAFLAHLIAGAQGHRHGCPPRAKQRICFANHQSPFDWVLPWAALPRDFRETTRPIAAPDDWTARPLKHWITHEVFNVVYVSRRRTDDKDPLEPLKQALRNDDSLVIFAEGTRDNGADLAMFKSGLYHHALELPQVQLIPAWICNVRRVMPKGEVIPVPLLCCVTFGAPMSLQQGKAKAAFLHRARGAVIALRGVD